MTLRHITVSISSFRFLPFFLTCVNQSATVKKQLSTNLLINKGEKPYQLIHTVYIKVDRRIVLSVKKSTYITGCDNL